MALIVEPLSNAAASTWTPAEDRRRSALTRPSTKSGGQNKAHHKTETKRNTIVAKKSAEPAAKHIKRGVLRKTMGILTTRRITTGRVTTPVNFLRAPG